MAVNALVAALFGALHYADGNLFTSGLAFGLSAACLLASLEIMKEPAHD